MIKGMTASPETRQKISQNHARPMLGKKHTPETLKKMSESKLGERSYQWKGENVGYRALHRWVGQLLGKPDECKHCGKTGLSGRQIHWANISGQYKRVVTDWIRLCVKCHSAFDRSRHGN